MKTIQVSAIPGFHYMLISITSKYVAAALHKCSSILYKENARCNPGAGALHSAKRDGAEPGTEVNTFSLIKKTLLKRAGEREIGGVKLIHPRELSTSVGIVSLKS